jgi:MinD-like ATPase involved in chromosome partitioning or flagellar assembly
VNFCSESNVELIGLIPFDPIVTKAMVAGTPIIEYAPKSIVANSIKKMWNRILNIINSRS